MESTHLRKSLMVLITMLLITQVASAQNLLVDPSFEEGFVVNCNQGHAPETWFNFSSDVFSENCQTKPGIPLGTFGHFGNLVGAYDGLRFMGGWGNDGTNGEPFGQELSFPLSAGNCYELSGGFTLSAKVIFDHPGVFDIYISPTTSFSDGIMVASIGGVAQSGLWTADSVTFEVPAGYNDAANIIFQPRALPGFSSTYPAADGLVLTEIEVDCVTSAVGESGDNLGMANIGLLSQNHPNPFNPSTVIKFEMKADGPVKLMVYSLDGRLVRSLVDDHRAPGIYTARWSGNDDRGVHVASGTYLYRLTTTNYTELKMMTLLK